ncbi:hypothetical protein [Haloarchaeobius sp. DT45]|uniref:hypothetical protein n=1 Tax=Haloarchaeobius sp. DT45 TaxID=3446116 RepID=UPI003F6B5983
MKLLQRLTGLFGSKDGGQSPDAATEQTATPTSPAEAAAGTAEAGPTPDDDSTTDAVTATSPSAETAREVATPVSESTDEETTADADPEPEPEPEPRDRTEVFREQAAQCVENWPDRELDYSPASLSRLDELASDLAADGVRDRQLVLSLGSYFGETLLRETEGEWQKPASGAWAVVLAGEETDVTLNVFQIADTALAGTGGFAATYRSVEHRL